MECILEIAQDSIGVSSEDTANEVENIAENIAVLARNVFVIQNTLVLSRKQSNLGPAPMDCRQI